MNSGLSVLFWMDDGGDGLPGGNVTQMRQTAAALERAGCRVDITNSAVPDGTRFDVVHVFNIDHTRLRVLRRRGIRTVISPIYWPLSFRSGRVGPSPTPRARLGRASLAARSLVSSMNGSFQELAHSLTRSTRELALAYESADLLLPNSQAEAASIKAELGVSTLTRVVPNAADPVVFRTAQTSARSGVVMAARIEPLKNQLALIDACTGLGLELTLVGRVHPHHAKYGAACARKSRKHVRMVDHLPPRELARLFAGAKVHALPSWFETTGLSSLEAALAGCAVVASNRGYAREYFGADAEYCDPASSRSIAGALERAYNSGPPAHLQSRVAAEFNWDVAAAKTLAAYREIL